MSRFRCVCGYVVTTSGEIPNHHEWLYISDVDFDGYSGLVDAEELYRTLGRAFVCPKSGHLWVFKEGLESDPVGYVPMRDRLPPDV